MKLPRDEPATTGPGFAELAQELVIPILCTIKAGWEIAQQRPDVTPTSLEVPLTERLRGGMREALSSRQLEWGKDMIVMSGSESMSSPELSRPDGLLDISIISIKIFQRLQEHDPHAIIECKRISGSDANLCREYVINGIDRFRTGKYAGRHRTGFMVGYLVAARATAAVNRVNLYLTNKSRQPEHLQAAVLITGSRTWRSIHPRVGSSNIELKHTLLSFDI